MSSPEPCLFCRHITPVEAYVAAITSIQASIKPQVCKLHRADINRAASRALAKLLSLDAEAQAAQEGK